jgi:succinate dehydrogenase/fumarate reductase-like Fe-S protein
VVDRSAFDIMAAGGFVSVNTSGNTLDANAIPVPKEDADKAMDAAACIGCGACVATCKNGSAMLFVGAKVSQFALLPQGRVEAKKSTEYGKTNGRRRFRKLFEHRLVKLNERNFSRKYRKNEQRVSCCKVYNC